MDLLNHYKNKFEGSKYNLVFLTKDQATNLNNFQKLFEIIRNDTGISENLKMGGLPKEKQIGPFVNEFEEYVKLQGCSVVDSGNFYQELYSIKEPSEIVFCNFFFIYLLIKKKGLY